jgi:spermidine/putrescine-binding protein
MRTLRLSGWSAPVLAAALLLSACGGGEQATGEEAAGSICPPKVEGIEVTSKDVNIFVWTEYIPQEAIDCFEEVYGVNVNRDEYSSNEELYAKISAGSTSYDLIQPTDYIVPLLIRQGLVQEWDRTKMPVLDGMDPSYMDQPFDPGNKYTIPYQAGTYGIVVNTDVVKDELTSWDDLWNPAYANRLIFLDDMRAAIGVTLLTLGYDINTTDPVQLEEAKVKLAEVVKGIKIFDSDSPKTALIAGDVDLGMTWTGEAFLAQQENPAIQYIYPSEGTILWQDNYALLKDAPHADAAYAWLNYTMQPEVFWMMLRDFPYNNPSTATLEYAKTAQPDLYNAYMDSTITNVPAEVFASGQRLVDLGEAAPLYDQIWIEVKGQ